MPGFRDESKTISTGQKAGALVRTGPDRDQAGKGAALALPGGVCGFWRAPHIPALRQICHKRPISITESS